MSTVAPDRRVPAYLGRVLDADGEPAETCFQLAPAIVATAWHVLNGVGASALDAKADRAMSAPRVYGHAQSGRPITDVEIERYGAEAGAGYDVDALIHRRGARELPRLDAEQVAIDAIMLDPALRDELAARANADGTTTSEVIREALRRYLRAA